MGCYAMQWKKPEMEVENVGHDVEWVIAMEYTANPGEDWNTNKGFRLEQGTPFG